MASGSHARAEECRQIFALLSQYLDAELPAETCDQIEAHLKDCPPCLEFLDSLRKTVELCRRFEPGDLPAPLSDAVRGELKQLYQEALKARQAREQS
ncbi:MAG: anti-sigma factor family protein [Bryobacteraceae bacterium]